MTAIETPPFVCRRCENEVKVLPAEVTREGFRRPEALVLVCVVCDGGVFGLAVAAHDERTGN